MGTIKSVIAPIITNPVGVDAFCQSLQLQLATDLEWLERSYGKALVVSENRVVDNQSENYIVPKVYRSGREFLSIEPEDTIKAFSFFYETNPETVGANWSKSSTNINLVVFANNELITDINEDYLFIEVLKEQVLESIQKNSVARLGIIEDSVTVTKHFSDTWIDFSVSDTDSKWIKHNYSTFRINFDCTYSFDCPVIITGASLLKEDGFYILLENGDKILLEY